MSRCRRVPGSGGLLILWALSWAPAPAQAGALLGGGAAAPKVHESADVVQPARRPAVVYVSDFYLDANQVQQKTLLGREGPLRRRLGALLGHDPETRAKKLVSALAQTITQALRDGGQPTEYLSGTSPGVQGAAPGGTALPSQGWLVGGWFVSVNEGNRVLAASVGFGSGAETVELQVTVSDLARHPLEPFLFMGSASETKRRPGGLLMGNPYVLAAKYVITRGATEADVERQGEAVAKGLLEYLAGKAGPRG